jgi:hypothetical protein
LVNIPHSSLTGADLHESKGVSSAPANTIFVADGVGSGSFAKLPAAAISGLANPFGASLLHVREEQAQGSGSVVPNTINTWLTTPLGTVRTAEISGASLTSSQITLPAGTYFIDASIPWFLGVAATQVGLFKARLYNFTAASSIVEGQSVTVKGGLTGDMYVAGQTVVRGRFTLAGASALILQQIKNVPYIPGYPAVGQGNEVYADVLIWKTA